MPPSLDGIGDYTAHLAAALKTTSDVSVLTRSGELSPIDGVALHGLFQFSDPSSMNAILPVIERDKPDWVILQYNPFGYGKWGRNLTLPKVARRIAVMRPQTRFAFMVHEPYVQLENPKFCVMTTWQRYQFWALGQAADCVFCSIEHWAGRFQRWFPKNTVHHLPVGSNISLCKINPDEAKKRLGLDSKFVIGMFGTLHVSRLVDRLALAVEAALSNKRDVAVLYVGPNKDIVANSIKHLPVKLVADGALSAQEVSLRLQAIDLYVVAFNDGVSTRRGSLMAGLEHGLPTVGTKGVFTDNVFLNCDGDAIELVDAGDANAFSDKVKILSATANDSKRLCLGRGASELFQENFTWPKIADKMVSALQSAKVQS
jgi:glycosyltransferase involved in cell wall biosynthesis